MRECSLRGVSLRVYDQSVFEGYSSLHSGKYIQLNTIKERTLEGMRYIINLLHLN